MPETSATATESVPASSAGLEQPAQPVTASAPLEQTQTASPAPAASESHSSSASTADGSTMQLALRPCRGTPLLRLLHRLLRFLALDAKGGERVVSMRVRGS